MRMWSILSVVVLAAFLALSPGAVCAEGTNGDEADPNGLILYVQQGCPHCEEVELFIEKYGLEEHFVIKDLSLEPEASEEYTELLDTLEVPLGERGVPLLVYDDDQWMTGDTPIISFIKERFDIREEERERVSEPGDYAILAGGMIFVGGIVGYGIVKVINDRAEKE
jgi:glutaredoxin